MQALTVAVAVALAAETAHLRAVVRVVAVAVRVQVAPVRPEVAWVPLTGAWAEPRRAAVLAVLAVVAVQQIPMMCVGVRMATDFTLVWAVRPGPAGAPQVAVPVETRPQVRMPVMVAV